MQILLLIILAVLIYIAYQFNEFVKKNRSLQANPIKKLTSTLNPLFTEEEIQNYKQVQENNQAEGGRDWDKMIALETLEIKEHYKSGKEKSTFKPSKQLKQIMSRALVGVLNRNNARYYWRKMVEANIAILNGAEIDKVEKDFYGNKELELEMGMDTDINYESESVKKKYQEFIKAREEYWRNSWEHIIKKND